MNELTNCEVDIVGGDGEFVVSRVRSGEDLPSSLLFSPALKRPAPASLAKLERSFALRGELNPSWAAAACGTREVPRAAIAPYRGSRGRVSGQDDRQADGRF